MLQAHIQANIRTLAAYNMVNPPGRGSAIRYAVLIGYPGDIQALARIFAAQFQLAGRMACAARGIASSRDAGPPLEAVCVTRGSKDKSGSM